MTENYFKRKKDYTTYIIGIVLITVGIISLFILGKELNVFLKILYIIIIVFIVIVFLIYMKQKKGSSNNKQFVTILLSLFILSILVGSSFLIIYYIPNFFIKSFDSKPYLSWGVGQNASNSICISWVSSTPLIGSVKYGISRSQLDNEIQGINVKTEYHHINITGLFPNTTYYYQVSNNNDIYHFKTAPTGIFNFSFSSWADHRTNTPTPRSVWQLNQPNIVEHIDRIFKETNRINEFSLFAGDMVSSPYEIIDWKTWFEDISYNNFSCNTPIQIVYGNHERYGDEPNYTMAQNIHPLPMSIDNTCEYSFDYGIAHFIILDPYKSGHTWSQNFTENQLNWLKNDLETNKDAPYIFIFMHPYPLKLNGIKSDLEILCGQYNITMIFGGHYHSYEHNKLNGTDVVLLGLGGNPNNDFQAIGLDCGTAFGIYDVTPDNMKFTAQMINGTKLLELTIPSR